MAEVRGIEKLRQQLKDLPAAQIKAVKGVLFSGGIAVQAGAKRRAPVKHGRLRNSIAVERSPDELEVRVGTNVEYARRIEFGFKGTVQIPAHEVRAHTRNGKPVRAHSRRAHTQEVNQPARPFLQPAFEEERPKIMKRLNAAMSAVNRRSR